MEDTQFTQRICPNVPASFAADLGDTDSEISQFVDMFFTDYFLSRVPEDRRSETIDAWEELEDVVEQETFLNQIEPDFMNNFQVALNKELINLFTE